MIYLWSHYPSLYLFSLRLFEEPQKLKEDLMKECQGYHDSVIFYSNYIHGYFIPWLDQQRAAGKLKQGKL